MSFLGDIGRFIGGAARAALPVVGGAVLGPLGAAGGAAISRAIGGGGGRLDPAALLTGGMNAAQAQQAAAQVARANALREQAAAGANADYASRDPLRQFAIQQLMQGPEARPDFSSAIADPGNPFATPLARPQAAATPPMPSVPTSGPATAPRTPNIPPEIVRALTQKIQGGLFPVSTQQQAQRQAAGEKLRKRGLSRRGDLN